MKLDVKSYVNNELELLAEEFKKIGRPKKLWIFTDHSSVAAESYMKSKINVGKKVGVDVEVISLESTEQFLHKIDEAIDQEIPTILQYPVGKEYKEIYNLMEPHTDVDGFFNYEDVMQGNTNGIIPATPKGIVKYLHKWCMEKKTDLSTKNVVILGRGELIGKPLAALLIPQCGSVSMVTSKTLFWIKDSLIERADIIILATGNDQSLDGMILSQAELVIDTGVFRDVNNKLYGEFGAYLKNLSQSMVDLIESDIDYTPVPSGVGILTTMSLFDNVLQFYKL